MSNLASKLGQIGEQKCTETDLKNPSFGPFWVNLTQFGWGKFDILGVSIGNGWRKTTLQVFALTLNKTHILDMLDRQ